MINGIKSMNVRVLLDDAHDAVGEAGLAPEPVDGLARVGQNGRGLLYVFLWENTSFLVQKWYWINNQLFACQSILYSTVRSIII